MIKSKMTEYQSSKYAKAMAVSEAKVGKSCYLTAGILGVLPWQKRGGIVDKPENLHVITFDANALGGVQDFITKLCGGPTEALNFNVYNMQDDVRRISTSQSEYDYSLFNSYLQAVGEIRNAVAKGGIHAVLVSSLTGIAQALERAIAGPAGRKKGGGMDQSKWGDYAHQLNEIRNVTQQDSWHCIWEGHIYKPPATGQSGEQRPETLQISGKSGQNFAYNVEQVFRIRRQFGTKAEGTNVDRTYLDTQPSLDFISGGRKFTEALEPQEACPTKAFQKLGLTVGGWGAKAKVKAVK